jgi:N-acylneuraminate cytidylyltransferase
MRKDIKDISVFLNIRAVSTRCKNKMLRPFAGSTLVDICLNKLHKLSHMDIFFGAHEDELLNKATHYSFLKCFRRSYESAGSRNDALKIFEILNHINAKWVLWINPCVPFLKMETVLDALDTFLVVENNSLASVKRAQGWFFDTEGKPLTNANNSIATQDSDYLYEAAHAFHIYERRFFLEETAYWGNSPNNPYLFEIPEDENIDIDTELEFKYAEMVYLDRINRR